MTDNITPNAQPGATDIASGASDASGAVSNAGAEMLTLPEINQLLGKSFKDKTTALASLKEMQSYTGKRKEDFFKEFQTQNPAAPKVDESRIKRLEDELFYSQNPQYTPHKAVIAKMGDNPSDVVATPEFKNIFDDLQLASKTKSARTVLESNPRIGQVRDKMKDARTKASQGSYTEANRMAVESVMETFTDDQ